MAARAFRGCDRAARRHRDASQRARQQAHRALGVFAGPRGVGKTTTARILARALNCVKGPTTDLCGVCDACIEIAEGRDIDVLEIDAATHTQVDKVRDIIIAGLGITPVRDRYKIFIIDEVHRLSVQAFDALLKSLEEPPPHALFMMATTELEKVPPTIQSRSQVFELKAVGSRRSPISSAGWPTPRRWSRTMPPCCSSRVPRTVACATRCPRSTRSWASPVRRSIPSRSRPCSASSGASSSSRSSMPSPRRTRRRSSS